MTGTTDQSAVEPTGKPTAKRARSHILQIVATVAIAALFAALMAILAGPNFVTRALHIRPASTQCDPQAVAQLPGGVVNVVNAAQDEYQISSAPIAVDLLPRDGTAEHNPWVFVHFEPKYCGFVANINSNDLDRDVVNVYGPVLDDGINPAAGICISNTVPTAFFNELGGATLDLRCDRIYPHDTWIQEDPILVELPRTTR